ncbi:hypothetical protein [Streptomyces sp. N50]|uniref:hypothetical protein n=1 Tax=Streptomyces sp. N50 TaxID=3081765 RepID=UPI002962222B|nr:hypothetical protein [Streptomyces sp. N50]WOX12332.1 hypothetical protein R2B38_27395 [Streptomyces sp. N50]
MTINAEVPVAAARGGPVAGAGGHGQQEAEGTTSGADLVLPLVALGGVGVLAGYGYVRRTRRARTRTTPGVGVGAGVVSTQPPVTPLPVLERQAGAALVQADDCLRTSREELAFAEARFGAAAVEPFVRALRDAERELSAAFAIRLRYDRGVPEPKEEAARRQALAGIVGRCAEAGRRLDAEAPAFDQLRALEREMNEALGIAETRFRELAARTGSVDATLTDLHARYPAPAASTATTTVTGYVEQAKDRLVFATTHLNQGRQAADLGHTGEAVRSLRAAEGAISQADVLLNDIDRLANSLATAAELVPATLTGAESHIARATARTTDTAASATGPLHTHLTHAHTTLAAVREELTGDRNHAHDHAHSHDPLDALRRIVQAMLPLGGARDGVLGAAAWLVTRNDVGSADGFVATHRGAVGVEARTRLAEAELLLNTDPASADEPALEARELAEQDVRVHGNPYAGTADEHTSGVGGAVLGGILLGEDPDGGPPLTFGGPATRKRRALPPT